MQLDLMCAVSTWWCEVPAARSTCQGLLCRSLSVGRPGASAAALPAVMDSLSRLGFAHVAVRNSPVLLLARAGSVLQEQQQLSARTLLDMAQHPFASVCRQVRRGWACFDSMAASAC